ncbi:hypothetical protein JCM11641_003736 [Rhodosporidiobolus odoratus]
MVDRKDSKKAVEALKDPTSHPQYSCFGRRTLSVPDDGFPYFASSRLTSPSDPAPYVCLAQLVSSRVSRTTLFTLGRTVFFAAYFAFALVGGAASSVDMEVMNQIACRGVQDAAFLPAGCVSFLRTPRGDNDWAERCRTSPLVQARTTEIVTTISLTTGILSALTAAWWGSLADRKGRRPVLALVSLSEALQALSVVLLISFPSVFGYRFLLAGAVLSGLSGGALSGVTTAIAYLGDCSVGESKTQLLSTFEATQFLGGGIGPILLPLLFRLTGLDIAAPYALTLASRILYFVALLFMPESLPRRAFEQPGPAQTASAQHRTLLARSFAAPGSLFAPLKVLLPKKVHGGRRDWRLTLVAISFATFMIVPGLGNIKILYARSRFGWGVEDVGRWMSFGALCKLIILLGILPLLNRFWRKPAPRLRERDDSESKKEADTAFDLLIARRSVVFALIGYIVMSFPTSTSRNFLVGTALTSFAAATPPALQSLALAFCAPEDAGKVLASITTLATISLSSVGPSLFGALYVAAVEWWPEIVFVLAAVWISCSLLSLLPVRLAPRDIEEEEA